MDAGKLVSGTGTVQVIAGKTITTTSLNGTSTEIDTAGKVLLEAGDSIGTNTNRIELANVSKLAGQTLNSNALQGDIWLRKLGAASALEVGTVREVQGVNATAELDNTLNTATTASATASLVGLTSANNGNITLTTQGGNLTLSQAVTANGSGFIDLRTASTGANGQVILANSGTVDQTGTPGAAVDAGKLVSGTGTVQVIAGTTLTTTSANGVATEIQTTTDVLLEAGTSIGTDANRIEVGNAAKLAGRTLANAGPNDIFVRKLGAASDLEVGAVAVVNNTSALDNQVSGALAVLNGLSTTAGNGNITLTTQGGDLTVTQAVTAHGTGYVDIRTANAGNLGDIAINNGATVSSTGGTVQVVAGNTLTTDSVTNTATEIQTTGNVLIQAGGAVGTAANAVDLANVAKLAVSTLGPAAGGAIFVNQTAGNLELGAVGAVNAGSALDVPVASLTSVTTANNNDATVMTQGASSLSVGGTANVGTGTLFLAAGQGVGGTGNLTQTAGTLIAGRARLDAGGDVTALLAGNRVNVLASVSTNLNYLEAGALTIDTVAGQAGILAGTRVFIRSQGDLSLNQPVVGNGTGTEGAVLVSDGAFRNFAGAGGVLTPGSRWLIYDINPALEYRLGGLPNTFTRVDSTFAAYPPEAVAFIGNIYIPSPKTVPAQQFAPPSAGDPAASSGTVSATPQAAPDTVVISEEMLEPDLAPGGSGQFSTAALGALLVVQAPLTVTALPGRFFEATLLDIALGAEIESVTLDSGAPLPAWIFVDMTNQRLTGVMPTDDVEIPVRLRLKDASGRPGRDVHFVLKSGR